MTFEDVVEAYHAAVRAVARGNAEPVKDLFAHASDVTLANPFGPAVQGWAQVSNALDYAASRFADGDVTRFDSGSRHVSAQLAVMFEVECWEAKVAGREDAARFDLRVTSVFRREGEAWRLVHRHADPIATPDPDGPLRAS